jgi:hypothetical protein
MENKITIFDATTGESIEREMTAQEKKNYNLLLSEDAAIQAEAKAKAAELRALKVSAYEKLGLTPEEIEALLPTVKNVLEPIE